MLADHAGISLPTFPILNMSDVAAEQGKRIDADVISKKLRFHLFSFLLRIKGTMKIFYKALEKPSQKKQF
ncbi:MAG: hypothetical protein MR420_05570 [Spirochaetia bacterium]|nr:hypothetical protein [Spirochaetia bacterium]